MSNKAKTDPVIGITCSSEARAKPYSSIVERFGGEVKYLIPGRKETWKEDVSEIDGLLLSGGLDVHPDWYGQPPQPGRAYSKKRDELEINLVNASLKKDIPVLAICRGMQLLNVAMGGSIVQSLAEHDSVDPEDPSETDGKESSFHRIFISPGCRLASTVGSGGFVRVNSRHHQGLKEPQKSVDLMTSAWSLEDGVIEALESPVNDWVLGVQFHPERRGELPPHFDRLFETLVYKAKSTI